jgi:hypothetical protein
MESGVEVDRIGATDHRTADPVRDVSAQIDPK